MSRMRRYSTLALLIAPVKYLQTVLPTLKQSNTTELDTHHLHHPPCLARVVSML